MQRLSIRNLTATQDNNYFVIAWRKFRECETSVCSRARYQFAVAADQMYLC